MEGIKLDEINYENHIDKCRICFKSFATEEHWVDMNKSIEKKFFLVTQTNLKMTNQYSKRICVICNFQLTTFCHAKINMIKSQKALNKFIITSSKLSRKYQNSSPNKEIIQRVPDTNQISEDVEEIKEEEIIEEHLIDDENIHEISYRVVNSSESKKFVCGICGHEDSDGHMKCHDDHSSVSHQDIAINSDFQCNINQILPTSKINHRYIHKTHKKSTTLNKWTCHECKKSFSGGSSLTNHIAIFHSESKIELPCPVMNCDKKCRTKKQLTQHLKAHNEDKQICPECGLVVGNKHNLTKHIRRLHLKIYNFYCDLCDYKGFFKFNIDQHMKKHLDKSERERFYCDECHFESISKMSLKTHKRMEHLGQRKTYICHCGKTFTQSSSYYTHVKVVHQKIKNHICPYPECSKAFSEKSQLKNHIKSQHLKKRDIPCSECGKFFSTQKHLAAHLKYHKPPSFICQYENCNNSFYTSTQLNSHYKVHKNQRDYACQFCEKKYFHRSHLKKHLLTHSNNNNSQI